MSTHELPQDTVRAALERLGLDPTGVDLAWLARVKHDTEQRIDDCRRSPEFSAILALAAEPPSD
jgi:hypothetical protein